MKKIVTALVLVAMVLSIFSMTAFAVDQNTLTKAQYEELKAAADFVETFRHKSKFNWQMDLLGYMDAKTPQYITEKYDDGSARAAEVPANLLKDLFYEAFVISNASYFYEPVVSPKGFFESDILPYLSAGQYNSEKGIYDIYDDAMGGGYYSVLNGYIENSDSTYSFYYAIYSDYGTYEAGETPEVIVITLKLENDGIALVSDKKVDKLPTKYSEVPTATASTETPATETKVI